MSADRERASTQGIAIRTVDLVAGYGSSAVIHSVSIEVSPAEVVSIVGPNGSGKSTLLKAIVGVSTTFAGQIHIGDRDVTGMASEEVARLGVGYVPQVDDVFAPLTVRENLEMGGYMLSRREIPARIERVLSVFPQLGRMLSRRAGKLSGGERKMLAMGRILMLEPRLVVLDEPTANLAPGLAHAVLNQHVRQLAGTGASVLIVEQRARAVLEISDRTYVLVGGQLRMSGTPAELAASDEFVASFLGGRVAGEQPPAANSSRP